MCCPPSFVKSPPPPVITPLSLHDALPIYDRQRLLPGWLDEPAGIDDDNIGAVSVGSERVAVLRQLAEHPLRIDGVLRATKRKDRKSTRLNSSHLGISYAVFCLKKKTDVARIHWSCRGASGSRRPRTAAAEARRPPRWQRLPGPRHAVHAQYAALPNRGEHHGAY